jgi:hypothetical protein
MKINEELLEFLKNYSKLIKEQFAMNHRSIT